MKSQSRNSVECLFNLLIEFGMIALGEIKLRRIMNEWLEWLAHYEKMQVNWHQHVTDDEWKKLRSLDVGGKFLYTNVEYNLGLVIDPVIKNSTLYSEFFFNVTLELSILNDLYSLRRDCLRNCYEGNYVYLKMKNNNISAEKAKNIVVNELYMHRNKAKELAKILKANRSDEFISYIDQMLHSMVGNHYWSIICERYKAPS